MISNYTHLTLNGLVCTEINGISGWMRHAEVPWRRQHHRGTCIAVKHTIYGITKGVACAIHNVYISFTFFKWNHIFSWIRHNSVWTVLVSRDIRINSTHISSVWYRKIKALKRNEQLKYINFVQWDTRRICIILATRQTVWHFYTIWPLILPTKFPPVLLPDYLKHANTFLMHTSKVSLNGFLYLSMKFWKRVDTFTENPLDNPCKYA